MQNKRCLCSDRSRWVKIRTKFLIAHWPIEAEGSAWEDLILGCTAPGEEGALQDRTRGNLAEAMDLSVRACHSPGKFVKHIWCLQKEGGCFHRIPDSQAYSLKDKQIYLNVCLLYLCTPTTLINIWVIKSGVVVHTCNPSPKEVEAEGSPEVKGF